jgi:hypothetical protein
VDRLWEHIDRSQTLNDCGNWDGGSSNSFSGNIKIKISLQCMVFTILSLVKMSGSKCELFALFAENAPLF